jgi:hypothetical protein
LKVAKHDPKTGEYDLEVTDEVAGLGFTGKTFTIKRGETVALKASYKPAGATQQRVTLAIDLFSGYCLFRSKQFEGELSKRGIDLDLSDDKADYAQRINSVKSGTTPLALFTIDGLLKASAGIGELPGTIVMVSDETTGAHAMVAYTEGMPSLNALNRADARIVVHRDSLQV